MFTIDDNDSTARKEAIFIDASGSIDLKLVQKHLGLWEDALKQYSNDFEVHFSCFDNKEVYNILRITKANINDIQSYKVVGGGGSELPPCWEYMKKHNMTHGLVFTDGYIHWGNDPRLDIHFLIHGMTMTNMKPTPGRTPPYGKYGFVS